jgi:hypothetical protein
MLRAPLFVVFMLLLAAPSVAQTSGERPQRGQLEVAGNSVGTPTYDLSGRLVGMQTDRFDAQGQFAGFNASRYDYDAGGRMVGHSYVIADAEELIVQRMMAEFQYGLPGVLRQSESRWYDGWDNLLNWQRETCRRDPESGIRTSQTDFYDAEDQLQKTRYVVTEDTDRGQIAVRDISVYAPDNTQLQRTYERWEYGDGRLSTITRITFDEGDEVVSRAVETHHYGERNRVTQVITETSDAHQQLQSTVTEHRSHDAAGRIVARTITHANALGLPTRRYVESTRYDNAGQIQARRSHWESLQ